MCLHAHLAERVIGRGEAVTAVAAAIRRARACMKDPRRPVGSFTTTTTTTTTATTTTTTTTTTETNAFAT